MWSSSLPSPAGHHHAGLLSCSSESSLHTLHRKKGRGDAATATQSNPDLASLAARKSGSAAAGKPPLQPKKVQPVESGSPKASSKGTHTDGNQVRELP